jgi:uncharacterized protein (TIGR02145 family)
MCYYSSISQESETFNDTRDDKVYKTVKIGEQTWMAENLSFKPLGGKYWAYDYKNENVTAYGYLYDWETACDVCPKGWKLPSKNDFDLLLDTLGETGENAYTRLITGGDSGFSALYGGCRGYYGYFSFIEEIGYFWSSTSNSSKKSWNFVISSYESAMVFYNFNNMGLSVRCIKKD